MPDDQIVLTFRVPDEDFDLITVEVALIALEKQIAADPRPIGWDEEQIARRAAYRVLHCIHTRYCETLGHHEYIRTDLTKEHSDA